MEKHTRGTPASTCTRRARLVGRRSPGTQANPMPYPWKRFSGWLTAGFMKPRRLGKIERLGSCPLTTEQKYCSQRRAIESLLIVWRLFASQGRLSLEGLPCCDQFRGVIDPLVKGGGEGEGEIARGSARQ